MPIATLFSFPLGQGGRVRLVMCQVHVGSCKTPFHVLVRGCICQKSAQLFFSFYFSIYAFFLRSHCVQNKNFLFERSYNRGHGMIVVLEGIVNSSLHSFTSNSVLLFILFK